MNFSLKNRVAMSFGIATIFVLVLSFTVFNYLNNLNRDIDTITVKSNKVSLLTDEIRISAVSIIKYQRRLLTSPATPELLEKLTNLCESFTSQLQTLDSLFKDPEVTKIITKMMSYVDSLKMLLGKASFFGRGNEGMNSIGELADKILEAFSDFQDIQYFQSIEREKKIKAIINETKRNMMIALIIGFLGTIVLGLVIPGKIALPFKKIKDTIRELQECNFEVSIFYNQDDEIGEIANEMNKMIHNLKVFEELRADRISVERRKFDALANLSKKSVLVANAEGKIVYMNNSLYGITKLQSEDVIGKSMSETMLPKSIIDIYSLAIKRRSKIDNAEVEIFSRQSQENEREGERTGKSLAGETSAQKIEPIFSGYANVIPVRGKDSSLDYYVMVISNEVFT